MNVIARIARYAAVAVFVTWAFLISYAFGAMSEAEAANAAPTPTPQLEERREAPQTTVEAVSRTVMCPTCDTTLEQSDSPAAQRMRAWVEAAVAAGWTDEEIRDGLVSEYGGDESILASPRAQGIGIAAWLVPVLVACGAVGGGIVVLRRWRRQPRSGASGSESTR